MDPNEALSAIRRLIAIVNSGVPADDGIGTAAIELADTVDGLDDWLSNGGFLPAEWAR